ncbi:MAG: peptidoglycan DD-metalloendopeptidase family protein [Clostridia bacterium]|jgi:murein DD-endopeptidase MepM/ murein hydrolase activator NlpD
MKNIVQKIIVITIISILLLYTNTLIVSNAANEISNYQAEQKQNESKITETQEKMKEVEKIKDETLKEVEKLNVQISDYEGQIETLDEQIVSTNKKIEDAQTKLQKAQKDYENQEKLLKERLVASYEAGETSYLDFLLSSESLTDLISNYYLVEEIASYDAELLDKIEKEKKEIEQAKQTLENSKKELATQKASKQSVSLQLKTSKSEKDKYVSQLSEEEKQLQSRIDQLKKDNQSIDAKIRAKQAEIEAALKRQQEQNRNNSNSGSNNSSSNSGTSSSGFIKPVNSYVTTGMYYSSGAYHGAVDFGAAGVNGMPVYAAADGIVHTTAALTTSYGNYVIIAHYNGLYTLYAHGQAGSICVSEGQEVKKGQQIMRVGSTGNSTGPHLHFEVRKSPGTYSCRVNPLSYLP